MALTDGSQLGPYTIIAPIGAGGMGEVYRGTDTRLDRSVAIKVLPTSFAADGNRRQRLEREAKAISQLSHPHICTLHDIGREDDVDFLVMEFIDGESLAARLEKGPLPVEETLKYAAQIADALAAAHRQGIVHRDLKPGNVMLTKGGVKLLDFGLAKITEPTTTEAKMTQGLPTLTTPLTAEGAIIGTYHYMAPEQLEGEEADERSDIFAFGGVLYEMATGRRAFNGSTPASLISSILRDEPEPISTVQPLTPPALDRVVQICLQKDPDDRWQSAADLANELRWVAEGGSRAGVPAAVSKRRRGRERLWIGIAAACALAAITAGAAWWQRAPEPPRLMRFQVQPPRELSIVGSPKISPDGNAIAFSGTGADGVARIWVRELDDIDARPLAGTEGAQYRPFWSPDSRYIGFIAGGKLKKVLVSGGGAQVVTDAPTGADGSWGAKDVILFDGQPTDPIRRVSAGSGLATPVVEPEVGWPEFLPDGEHFLYLAGTADGGFQDLMVGSLNTEESPLKLMTVESLAVYAPPGHLIFVNNDSLYAQPFDAKKRALTGEPRQLAADLAASAIGLADFSASANGTLVYRSGAAERRRLVWVDRAGTEIADEGELAIYRSPAISPDGTRIAFTLTDPESGNDDVWVRDLQRGVSTRLTFDAATDHNPVWSPDGSRIAFDSHRGDGAPGVYLKSASGSGDSELLVESPEGDISPHSWSSDGRWLLCNLRSPDTGWDLVAVEATGEQRGRVMPFVESSFFDLRPSISPDGRWVVYESSESGRPEVYVKPFPGPGGKWQISAAGGSEPWWNANGKEIFYLSAASRVVSVPVSADTEFSVGAAESLFEAQLVPITTRNRWAAAPDGERFLMLRPEEASSLQPMTVVLNWQQALEPR